MRGYLVNFNNLMRLTIRYYFLLLFFVAVTSEAICQTVRTPEEIYGDLFYDVQQSGFFPDSKTFVDCIPKKDPREIVADYLSIKNNPAIRFSLPLFLEGNFVIPDTLASTFHAKEKDLEKHINQLWRYLKRQTHCRYLPANGMVVQRQLIAIAASVHYSGWPLQGNLLLGFLFHHAGS
jgi:hypothetical protein